MLTNYRWQLGIKSMSALGVATPRLLFSGSKASANITAWTARQVPPSPFSTISSTLAPPKPRDGFACPRLPPDRASHDACPKLLRTFSGISGKSFFCRPGPKKRFQGRLYRLAQAASKESGIHDLFYSHLFPLPATAAWAVALDSFSTPSREPVNVRSMAHWGRAAFPRLIPPARR
jgi:hypothetical protein